MVQNGRTKRQRTADEKRDRILSSKAFQTWWRARQSFYPTPSDPYRAFMIDKGLFAKPHHERVWKHRTNRYDYPPVDFPLGTPRKKKRLPPRKHIKRFKKRPKAAQPYDLSPYEKELVAEAERFSEKFRLPRPRVRFEPRVSGGAAYIHGRPMFGIEPTVLMPRPFVRAGEKKKAKLARQQVEATLFHELGHHAHVAYGYVIRPDLSAAMKTPYPKAHRKEKERIAWKVAAAWEPFTPVKGWAKKTYLGTYLGTTPQPFTITTPKMRGLPKRRR